MSTITHIVSPPEPSVRPGQPVIGVNGLRKAFGDLVAVDGLSFTVPAGAILGLLGPNGAGKTTTVRMLTTLLPPDGGAVTIGGYDVVREPDMVRRVIGLAGQSAAVDEKLTTRENLDLFGRLYHLPAPRRRERIATLLARFDMEDYADQLAGQLSGGQRRRLDVVAALIAEPPAVFLDEPTTGLDPRGRMALWDQIRSIRDDGTAVVLTTQYLDEADRLADRIMLVDRGRCVAEGTTAELKSRLERDVLEVSVARADGDAALLALAALGVAAVDGSRLRVPVATADDGLAALRRLQDAGVAISDFQVRQPTLDDVFIELTGKPASSERGRRSDRNQEVPA
jgi:ABC-2 type transport system ATP-binding protein